MRHTTKKSMMAALLALSVAVSGTARAHRDTAASEASALSGLSIAVSVVTPVGLMMSGAAFTVVAVSAVAEGTVWVLERASDGARFSVTLSAQSVGAASLAVGTAVTVVACSTGWILSAAGTSSAAFSPENVSVRMNGVEICRAGGLGEDRSLVDLTPREVSIVVSLGEGAHEATILTSDLTHDYVHENSAYSS